MKATEKLKVLNHRFVIPNEKCYFACYGDNSFTYSLKGAGNYSFEINMVLFDPCQWMECEEDLYKLLDGNFSYMSIKLYEKVSEDTDTFVEDIIEFKENKVDVSLN